MLTCRLLKQYCVQLRHEMCETPEDFLARRTRLAFLDARACKEALPKVLHLCPQAAACCRCIFVRSGSAQCPPHTDASAWPVRSQRVASA